MSVQEAYAKADQNMHGWAYSLASRSADACSTEDKIVGKIKYLVLSLSVLCTPYAHAGTVEDGPYVVWVNLSRHPARIDEKIRSFVSSGKARCLPSTAVLFMRIKPKAITRNLVTGALVNKDKVSIKRLNAIMKRSYGEARDGFDGIVAYTDATPAVMYSLTTGRTKIEHSTINLKLDPQDIEGSFCAVVPEISRGP
jgi:hypothetical protein